MIQTYVILTVCVNVKVLGMLYIKMVLYVSKPFPLIIEISK